MWFGYDKKRSDSGVHRDAMVQARLRCLRECPLASQQACARTALAQEAAFGIWAGIELPGCQQRQRPKLLEARELLEGVASGRVLARDVPRNRLLLILNRSRQA
jgi:WhiB family transcriptional regulator, redox-sensing transcriptional regulator